ncbi:MAG: hypothetical protein WB809_00830 [Thermoplasmata archaeon]
MARPRGSTGIVGAVLVLVGLVLVGAGLLVVGNAEQSEINCEFAGPTNSCESTSQNAANASVDAIYVIGSGLIVGGAGAALVIMTMVGIMATRLERPTWPPVEPGPASWTPVPPPSGPTPPPGSSPPPLW